jgi:ADP-ribose pyrophosphatase YjhB (NUDIX family)
MLPGGGIEEGETPTLAAKRETLEETRLIVNEEDMRLIACFTQRSGAKVHLYETSVYQGSPAAQAEIAEVKFVCFDQALSNNSLPMLLGYERMLKQYLRCRHHLDSTPHEGRLFEEVLWSPILTKG